MNSPHPFFTFIKTSIAALGFPLMLIYWIASFSGWMDPHIFTGITFLAIGFPILFLVGFLWCCMVVWLFRKKSWLVFLLLLPGSFNLFNTYSVRFNQSFNASKNPESIRVLTWNVNEFLFSKPEVDSWKYDQGEMLQFIKEVNPDILCFQDYIVSPGWAERDIPGFIRDSLGFPYQFFSMDDLDYGTIIFSKFPIKNSGRMVYNQASHPESIAYADIEIDNKTVRLFNTHFRSMFLHHNTLSSAVLGNLKYVKEDTNFLFKTNRFERLEYYDRVHTDQAKQVLDAFDDTQIPFIFCADLNAVPSSYVYQLLRQNTLDTYLEKGAGLRGTYKKGSILARIDLILTSTDFKTVQYYSPKLNLSDHYPVIADLQLAN